jgi:tRNA(Arg) A34 adenosine deaminase TadA
LTRSSDQRRRDRIAIPALTLAAIMVGAIVLSQADRHGLAADGGSRSADRAVTEKHWVTADEIRGRFSPSEHETFMRMAIANSRKAGVVDRTGGAFGAVIVDGSGQVVGQGSNHVVSKCDPTWHGEMEAIRDACGRMKSLKLDGCVLYTSSEPCPMCLATAYWAGLDGIVYGAAVADSKKYGGFDDAFIYEQFAEPAADRSIPQVQLLRNEAVEVWKEYAAQPGNVPY